MQKALRSLRAPLLIAILALAAGLVPTGCGGDGNPARATAVFRFSIPGDVAHQQDFVAWTSNADVIAHARAELAKPPAERRLHPHGHLLQGDGGRNAPWHWHLDPDNWDLVEASIELCDGLPSDVEADLNYWINTVMSFCPWTARIESEIAQP